MRPALLCCLPCGNQGQRTYVLEPSEEADRPPGARPGWVDSAL